MASAALTSVEDRHDASAERGGRLRNLGSHARTAISLLAVYAPPVLVLLLNKGPIAKLYLVIGIWAIEGIVWYWLKAHVIDRAERGPDASFRPDYN
jgi:hypothetical protein